jgi:hypoxanthine-DNA glycosylase
MLSACGRRAHARADPGQPPGEASLAQSQYYAYKHNQFWRLAGEVIGQDLPGMDYDARLQALRAHRLGLWDVVAEAKREGSLDSKIRDHAGNDLAALIAALPNWLRLPSTAAPPHASA